MKTSSRRIHGAATLAITMALFVGASLIALYATRTQWLAQRTAAKQLRALQSFEAAEAGLDWALLRLNDDLILDADCRPGSGGNDASLRSLLTRTQHELEALCLFENGTWHCECAEGGPHSRPSAAPTFRLSFAASSHPETLDIASLGCDRGSAPCMPELERRSEAVSRHTRSVVRMSALPRAPAAALTVRGSVDAGNSDLFVKNINPGRVVAVHAGGTIHAPAARLEGPAGTPREALVVAEDKALAKLNADELLASLIGMPRATWARAPWVHALSCTTDCTQALREEIARRDGVTSFHVPGDLTLSGPATLGTRERPVLIVAAGLVHVVGELHFSGLLVGQGIDWRQASGSAELRGALVSTANAVFDGPLSLQFDSDLLELIVRESGGYVPQDGSWRNP